MSSPEILAYGLGLAQLMLILAMVLAGWRVLRGPRAQDRVLALDAVYLDGMLAIVTHGMRTDSGFYFEAALILGMLGFAATVALAKFLIHGEVIR